MPKAKQLSLSVESRPGTLAHVARILGDAKVNILAFLATTSAAEGAIHIVPDNVNKAKKGFGRCGVPLHGGEVLHVELPNVPGAVGNLAGKLAAKDINISSGWQTTVTGSKKASQRNVGKYEIPKPFPKRFG